MKIAFKLAALLFSMNVPVVVGAQSPLQFAVYDKVSGVLEIVFSERIRAGQLSSHVLLVNTANGTTQKVPVSDLVIQSRFTILDRADFGNLLDLAIVSKEPVVAYIPFRSDPNKTDTTIASVSIRELEQPNEDLGKEAPKGRDDAELYLSGEIVTAQGSSTVYSVDAKYEKLTAPWSSPLRVGGFASVKASTSEADPNQFRIGGKFAATKFLRPRENRCSILCVIWWEGTAELEADKGFKVKNFISAQRVKFLPRNAFLGAQKDEMGFEIPVPRRTVLRFMPFIGGDFGRNLASPVLRDKKAIARIVGGASLELEIPKSPLERFGLESISWENTFTQRWFLNPEVAYDKNADGDLVLNSFGRKPRSHFISKLNLMITEFFGPTISYEWGAQPPAYIKIDHRVKFGLTYAYRQKNAR